MSKATSHDNSNDKASRFCVLLAFSMILVSVPLMAGGGVGVIFFADRPIAPVASIGLFSGGLLYISGLIAFVLGIAIGTSKKTELVAVPLEDSLAK